MEPIRSTSNSLVKRLRAVARGRDRDVVLLEGERLVLDAIQTGTPIELIAVRAGSAEAGLTPPAGTLLVEIDASIFGSLGSMKTTPSVLALAQPPQPAAWEELCGRADALVVVVAGIQDPGNLGALARTAEAAGASGLVILGGGCRPDHPRALRGSMGSFLRLPFRAEESPAVVLRALEEHAVRSLRAATRAGVDMNRADWSGRVALWMSAESGDAPPEFESLPGVTISLASGVESLNVTQAAAVLLFAANRNGDAK